MAVRRRAGRGHACYDDMRRLSDGIAMQPGLATMTGKSEGREACPWNHSNHFTALEEPLATGQTETVSYMYQERRRKLSDTVQYYVIERDWMTAQNIQEGMSFFVLKEFLSCLMLASKVIVYSAPFQLKS